MDNMYVLYAIGITALVTYLPRALPLVLIRTKIKNTFIRSLLTYMPYGVLSAMIFPAVFYSTGSVISAAAGTAVALMLSYFKKGLLPVALAAVAAVLISEFIIY